MCKHLRAIKKLGNNIVCVQVDGEDCFGKENEPLLIQNDMCIRMESNEIVKPKTYILYDENGEPKSVYDYYKKEEPNIYFWKRLLDSEVKNYLENMQLL